MEKIVVFSAGQQIPCNHYLHVPEMRLFETVEFTLYFTHFFEDTF